MKRSVQRSPRRPAWDHARFWLPAVTLLGAGHASADDIEWSNINGGVFSVGSNWIGGVVPGAGDFAHFGRTRDPNQQAEYTVTFSSSPSNQGLVVASDSVTFDLNGNVYSLSSLSSFAMSIGTAAGGSGRLTVSDGVVATAPDAVVTIGRVSNSEGFLTISTGAQLLGPLFHVGDKSRGTLVVQNGADIVGGQVSLGSLSGITGTAAVAGAGSSLVVEDLTVGVNGSGTVNVNGGGQVECIEALLGESSGAIGMINVDGVNSRWTSSDDLIVGLFGQGSLNITGGAQVQSARGFAGSASSGTGAILVDGASQWMNQGELIVGDIGAATMRIRAGGLVQNALGSVGKNDGAGDVSVADPGSRWINSSHLLVAGTGAGTLAIGEGGEVRSVDGIIARHPGAHGIVTVSGEGSNWTMTGDLSVGGDIGGGFNGGLAEILIAEDGSVTADAVFIFPDGTLTLVGGTLDVSRMGLAFASGGGFEFLGGILHAGQIGFRVVNQGGTLAPPGSTLFFKPYTQQAGTMEIEIGGTTPGTEFDQVVVIGAASLGGTLDVRLINGFVPSPDQTFNVLDADLVIEGAFTNAANGQRLTTSDGHGSFLVHYGPDSQFHPTQVVLSDFGVCIADFNGDGLVDTRDVIAFLNAWAYRDPSADCDANGVIDTRDVLCFLNAWSAGC